MQYVNYKKLVLLFSFAIGITRNNWSLVVWQIRYDKMESVMKKNSYWPAFGFCSDDKYIWFPDYWSNVLCSYSIEENCINRVIPIPLKDNYDKVCMYSDIVKI